MKDNSDNFKKISKKVLEHYHCLENMYHSAPCNKYYLPKMIINEGRAEIVIPVKSDFFHAAGAIHGAVYFKILDDAAYFAANSLEMEVFVLTSNFNIYLTKPVSKLGTIKAVGKVVSVTKNQFICEAVAYNSEGKEIGRGTGLYIRSKVPLSKDIGYK
ncbi:MAG: PaaI family thioesterase [Promethearchaeota archaeon]